MERFEAHVDQELKNIMQEELHRQQQTLVMIPSENYLSQDLVGFIGNILTNKYAEGYPGKRYYQGNEFADRVETLAIERAKDVFGAEHANVQPHSGSQANMAAYFAVLHPGGKIMAMDLSSGGHLTHGSGVNFSGKLYEVIPYGVNRQSELLDYDYLAELAEKTKPDLIVTGFTAYPRVIDFARFRAIADRAGALLMADISHIAGLVAAGVHPSPVPYADIVTSTTHKTMNGPRGAIILCKKQYAEAVDRAVFPGVQGGPMMNIIAAKAALFKSMAQPGFITYQENIVKNARKLAAELLARGLRLVSGGTDNHLILVDVGKLGLEGRKAAIALEEAGIEVNFNTIPYDTRPPATASGIRLGTPAITNRGMGEEEMTLIAEWIHAVLSDPDSARVKKQIRTRVARLCDRFPVYETGQYT